MRMAAGIVRVWIHHADCDHLFGQGNLVPLRQVVKKKPVDGIIRNGLFCKSGLDLQEEAALNLSCFPKADSRPECRQCFKASG